MSTSTANSGNRASSPHRSLRLAGLLLASAALLAMAVACEPAVSDDAEVTISGRVLDDSGAPLAGAEVKLWKSAIPVFELDAVLAAVLDADDSDPFRTTTTATDGSYSFTLTGADANNVGGSAAAYFAVSTQRGDGQSAVASDSFLFSNVDLVEDVGDMQFWSGGSATSDAGSVDFVWDDAPTAPSGGAYNIAIRDRWFSPSTGNAASLPTEVLDPDATSAEYQFVAISSGFRYRTALQTLTYDPPQAPIEYTQTDNNNISAVDCEGQNLFDLNDGEVVGVENVEFFQSASATGRKCFTITLREEAEVSKIVIFNAGILNFEGAAVEAEVRGPGETEFVSIGTIDRTTNDFDTVYGVFEADRAVEEIRFSLTNDDASFNFVGEVAVFASEDS